MCSKVQQCLAQCEIAQDISEVNDGIVIFSEIMEDIWENRFYVHLPYVFKEKPINWDSVYPFSQTSLGLGSPDGDIKRKRENISGGEVDGRVTNEYADKDLKKKQNED